MKDTKLDHVSVRPHITLAGLLYWACSNMLYCIGMAKLCKLNDAHGNTITANCIKLY